MKKYNIVLKCEYIIENHQILDIEANSYEEALELAIKAPASKHEVEYFAKKGFKNCRKSKVLKVLK